MIIGISGKIGCGKDTVGMIIQALSIKKTRDFGSRYSNEPLEYLKNYEGKPNLKGGWPIKKFADKLKECTSLIIGCSRDQLENQSFKNTPLGEDWRIFNSDEILTPRKILQLLGTECGREIIHPNIWVNATLSSYKPGDNIIITDVRFPNEAESIKDREGLLIRVNRKTDNNSDHPSETSLDNYPNFHYIIDNNGSIEELVEKVKEILTNEKLL